MMIGFTSVPLDGAAHSGIHVDISHVAVTPIGMEVTANVELTATEGRSLVLKVECRDEAGVIGEGTHRRAIIDLQRFTSALRRSQN